MNKDDEETERFVEESTKKSWNVLSFYFHTCIYSCFSFFMTSTSINGLLQRKSMFVASSTQFRRLLTSSTAQNAQQQRFLNSKKLLDVGAGDGLVTLNTVHGKECEIDMSGL